MEDKQRANERIPRRIVGVQEKDEETIEIASRLAKAVVSPKHQEDLLSQIDPEKYISEVMYEGLPEPGKFLLDEIMKVLYLNNLDPYKYTVSYWSKVFSMEPQAFRAVISYVAFPVPDDRKQETRSILAFVDVEANLTIEQLEDLSGKQYMKFLESSKTKALVVYEEEKATVDIEKILKHDKVLQQVQKEFKELDEIAKDNRKTHHILQ